MIILYTSFCEFRDNKDISILILLPITSSMWNCGVWLEPYVTQSVRPLVKDLYFIYFAQVKPYLHFSKLVQYATSFKLLSPIFCSVQPFNE